MRRLQPRSRFRVGIRSSASSGRFRFTSYPPINYCPRNAPSDGNRGEDNPVLRLGDKGHNAANTSQK